MTEPIACSLDQAGAGARLAEWHALLSGPATSVDRPGPHEMLVRVAFDQLGEVVDLARREKACCPFFDFSLEIGADALTLRVVAPADATAVLDELARLHDSG